jgi:hypothetical protein
MLHQKMVKNLPGIEAEAKIITLIGFGLQRILARKT